MAWERDPMSPEAALERLRNGNQRFAAQLGTAPKAWRPELAGGQSPFAVVLGCSDSRVPVEFIFDQGLGDLFVIRVAGNIVAPSLLGSVEFAISKFGTRLVVVLGHSRCGAIEATVATMTSGEGPATRNLRSITDRIRPGIASVLEGEARRTRSTARLLDEAMRANLRASVTTMRYGSGLIEDALVTGRVALVGAVYDVESGKVEFLDQPAAPWAHQHEIFAD